MAGEVVEVGSQVQKFEPGDKVASAQNIYVSPHKINAHFNLTWAPVTKCLI